MIGPGAAPVTDFSAFAAMRADARTGENRDENLQQVASQFESLFINMMLKQMRQANESLSEGGLFDSKQSRFYRDMYDQQLATDMSDRGGLGLAPAIRRQLGGEQPLIDTGRELADYRAAPTPRAPVFDVDPAVSGAAADSREAFIARLRPHAEAAAQRLGMPAEALIAQAALETGWGKAMMRDGLGRNSHNLFGIKADGRWPGDRVTVRTHEYFDGVPVKMRADFRSYGSYQEAFDDYADFVSGNPRYREAMQADDPRAYFQALQQAGYATDPRYADKVLSILDRPELRVAADPDVRET